jgi:hypothetical protein
MHALRLLVARFPAAAVALLVAALAMKAVVPAGYMPAAGTLLTIRVCSIDPAGRTVRSVPVPAREPAAPAKPADSCTFASLSMAAAAGAPPVLLAAALVFIFLAALRPASPALPTSPLRLRPPLRGPPIRA